MKQSARCHQLERIKNGNFTVPANVVVPARFVSAGKAMELVAIHQFEESQCSTTQQDGPTSFTHSSTPANNPHNNTDTLESDDDNFRQPFDDEEEAPSDSTGPLLTISDNFASYVNVMVDDLGLSTDECHAIKLMILLRKTKASLSTYNDVMEWHLRATGSLPPHASVGNCLKFKSVKKIFSLLGNRYNMAQKVNIVEEIVLPFSHTKVKIVKNNAEWCVESLLTDPRIVDDDYLFWGNDPLSAPPRWKDIGKIGDINTGKAYVESYAKLIKKPGKQVLLPIILYTDGTATGQFSDLPVTPFKFTLGIFKRKARDRPYMWRTLGYVPKIMNAKSRGKRQLQESGHVESALRNVHDDEGLTASNTLVAAQDFHVILEHLLKDFLVIQERGFVWDLFYNGKEYTGVEFVPFVAFIKCDTKEADLLTGSYSSRGSTVSQLCRYCLCPTQETDDVTAKFPPKTVGMIRKLVDKNDRAALKALSQHPIDNACHQIRFGLHNNHGVHGSCPFEMLHALLLGIFKYTRDSFFTLLGKDSTAAEEINGLIALYSEFYSHQSDRDMPKTNFGSGIQQGKLTAKEYTGVMLLIATVLFSNKGHEILTSGRRSHFGQNDGVTEWTILVETLLMWEEWLKSDEMDVKDVERAERKHRYIMYLLRKVAPRGEGMGWKIIKFHGITHMADDIKFFGVPSNVDTESDEAGHKASKTEAVKTQKRKDKFDEQVSIRLSERHLLDLAEAEIDGAGGLWQYFEKKHSEVPNNRVTGPHNNTEYTIEGAQLKVFEDDNGTLQLLDVTRKSMGNKPMLVEGSFRQFCIGLTGILDNHLTNFSIRSTLKGKGVIFRSSLSYHGSIWRDWVMVDWGDDGVLPNKIYGFVDCRELPHNFRLNYGGLDYVDPGIYAIVESATAVSRRQAGSFTEMFTRITTDVAQIRRNRVEKLQFYLADVKAFDRPIVVLPDVGGPPNSYIMVKRRVEWRADFSSWLRKPYESYTD